MKNSPDPGVKQTGNKAHVAAITTFILYVVAQYTGGDGPSLEDLGAAGQQLGEAVALAAGAWVAAYFTRNKAKEGQ